MGSSQVDGGVPVGDPSRAAPAAETSGLPRQEGGAGRGYNTAINAGRENQADGRGSSGRGTSGTTEGLRTEVAKAAKKDDSGDREKLEDLSNQDNELIRLKMKYGFILLLVMVVEPLCAQIPGPIGPLYFLGQEYSKEVSAYRGKKFLMSEVLDVTEDVMQFEIDALTAASSGELTTLAYQCQTRGKEGLILGFYGNYWNPAGVVFTGYAYKNMTKESAVDLLMKVSSVIDEYDSYLDKDDDNNNVCFSFDDLLILVYKDRSDGLVRLRVFWDSFDSEWTGVSFNRTKRRFERYFVKKAKS